MPQLLFIFAVGLGGVFVVMSLLYGAIRLTASLTDAVADKKEAGEKR